MNYFIDFPTLSSLYGTNTENDDEKPPPELKTKEKQDTGLRKSDQRHCRETVDAMSRKEKSSWPDWQFWKRSDGPFGSFRNKTTKTTPAANCCRKEMNENKCKKSDVITNEPCSSNVIPKNEALSYAAVTKTMSYDPLVSYKNESNGSKHVVLNMKKVESLAGKESKKTLSDEKYLKNIVCKPATSEQRSNATTAMVKSKTTTANYDLKKKQIRAIDEKPRGKSSVVDHRSGASSKARQEVDVIVKKQQQHISGKVEQGRLHNVLKKDTDNRMVMNGGNQAQMTSQNTIIHGTAQHGKLPSAADVVTAQKIGAGRQNVLQPGIGRGNIIQQQHGVTTCGLKMVRANEGKTSQPIMKDASTNTMKQVSCVKVDASTQITDDNLWNEDDCTDDNLLEKRPNDTERVLKMQVLLDEKEMVINKLKEAGRKQRNCLKACKKRCHELEGVITQASMVGKPELIGQVNELTDIKNDLIGEITSLTVDIERERSVVKLMKNELIDVKAQLEAVKRKNTNNSALL